MSFRVVGGAEAYSADRVEDGLDYTATWNMYVVSLRWLAFDLLKRKEQGDVAVVRVYLSAKPKLVPIDSYAICRTYTQR